MKVKARRASEKEPTESDRTRSGPRSTRTPLSDLHGRFGNRAVRRFVETERRRLEDADATSRGHEVAAERASREAARRPGRDGTTGALDGPTVVQRGPERRPHPPSDGVRSVGGDGRPLPPGVRSYFEPQFGQDFGDVRVHAGRHSAALTEAFDARAFTRGRDIHFAPGEYRPETGRGRRLLAHELAHVVQQRDGSAGGDPVQRKEREGDAEPTVVFTESETEQAGSEPSLEISVWETHEFEQLSEAFENHWTHAEQVIEGDLTDLANYAAKGAKRGVADIFEGYNEELIWMGVAGTVASSVAGALPGGGILSGYISTIMAVNLAKRGLRINELEGTITKQIEDDIDEKFLGEGASDRERVIVELKHHVAERYKRLVNEGRMAYDSTSMETTLMQYANGLLDVDSAVKANYRAWVIGEYGPIVDEALRPPAPRTFEPRDWGGGAHSYESGIIYQGAGYKG